MFIIYPSFSFLINRYKKFNRTEQREVRSDFQLVDSLETIYFFGCCREGIDTTFELYDRWNICPRDEFLATIFAAEKDNRVLWRTYYSSYKEELEGNRRDLSWLADKLGITIDVNPGSIRNLPTMREFFADKTNIQYML